MTACKRKGRTGARPFPSLRLEGRSALTPGVIRAAAWVYFLRNIDLYVHVGPLSSRLQDYKPEQHGKNDGDEQTDEQTNPTAATVSMMVFMYFHVGHESLLGQRQTTWGAGSM